MTNVGTGCRADARRYQKDRLVSWLLAVGSPVGASSPGDGPRIGDGQEFVHSVGSALGEARDPGRIRPGVMLVAGDRQAQAVVRVVAVDDDGQVHFTVLPGSVDQEPPPHRTRPSLSAR
jgi:hypothetical protein